MKLKEKYSVEKIAVKEAKRLVKNYHYLGHTGFLAKYCYGLVNKETGEVLGCAVFGNVQGTMSLKSWFGIENGNKDSDIYELTRLVLSPTVTVKNATSYLLGNALKKLHKEYQPKAVISLADTSRHIGFIYQATNFKYYGITASKCDFYRYLENEPKLYKVSRGKTKGELGVWLPRSRKHRYAIIYEPELEVTFPEEAYPKSNQTIENNSCCNNIQEVLDKRLNTYYSCPKCTGTLTKLDKKI